MEGEITEISKQEQISKDIAETSGKKDSTEAAVEKLSPQEFVDADGATRQLFTFQTKEGKNVRAVFYNREDLPYNKDVINNRQAFILGHEPRFRDIDDWKSFVKDVGENSANSKPLDISTLKVNDAVESGESLFFVENNPQDLLDLAFLLGADSPELRKARQLAARGEYDATSREIINNAIAATVINDEGKLDYRKDQTGEALTVLKLLGDTEASAEIQKKRGELEQYRHDLIQRMEAPRKQRFAQLKEQGIEPGRDATITHTTKYPPKKVPGGWEIQSAFDATAQKSLRNTVHFFPGAVVESHMMGDWDEVPYVVWGSLDKTFQGNQNTAKLRMVSPYDTYFTVYPGTRLLVSDGKLASPGRLPDGQLYQETEDSITYQSGNLSAQDVDAVLTQYRPNPHKDDWELNQELGNKFSVLWDAIPQEEKRDIHNEKVENLGEFKKNLDLEGFFQTARTEGIKAATANALASYKNGFTDEELDTITKNVNSWFVKVVRDRRMYSPTRRGGNDNPRLEMLAYQLGADYSSRAQAHDEDGLRIGPGEAYKIFHTLARYREERSKTGYIDEVHTPSWIQAPGDWKIIRVDDRKSIMERVRKERGPTFVEDPNVMAMAYLAGII